MMSSVVRSLMSMMWRLESIYASPPSVRSRISTASRPSVGLEVDLDPLLARRGHVLAHVVGADRQLAVAAVDENRQLDRARAPVVHDRVHRRADRAPGEQHVVDEDDVLALDVERDVGAVHLRREPDGEVVSVEADVERSDAHLGSLDLADLGRERLGEHGSAGDDADEREVARALVRLENLVRDARDGARDRLGVHHRRFRAVLHHTPPDTKNASPPVGKRGTSSSGCVCAEWFRGAAAA